MKQLEGIQRDIQSIESGMEMAGYLNGIEVGPLLWCKKNSPDDVYIRKDGRSEVDIYGMAAYLDSDIEE